MRRGGRPWHRRLREVGERIAGADPGLNQLRTATEVVGGVAVAVGLVYVFVETTGALQVSTVSVPRGVNADTTNQGLLVTQMLVAALTALTAGFVVNDTSRRQAVVSSVLLLGPALPALALGLGLGGHRLLSLVFLVALLMASVYVRRWGARGAAAGVSLFQAGFIGFVSYRQVGGLDNFGWLAVDTALGVVASLVVRIGVVRDTPAKTLARTRRAWRARAADLLDLGTDCIDTPGLDNDQRVHRQLVRLNEATLLVEGQLVVASPITGRDQARAVFGADLALTNCLRFCVALSGSLPHVDPSGLRADVRRALTAAREERWHDVDELATALRRRSSETAGVPPLVDRLALSLGHYADASRQLHEAARSRGNSHGIPDPPTVPLSSGYLPGSAAVSTKASVTPGPGRFGRSVMPTYLRSTIQIGVAALLAILFGELVDGDHVYWAVLTTYLAFLSTTNTIEEVRKALLRVVGTGLGIGVGDLVVHATGGRVSIALPIALAVLLAGIRVTRSNYILTVVGVTMLAALVYQHVGDLSWHLLTTRLAQTAVGVGAVLVAVLAVFPLGPRRVFAVGELTWFRALATVLDDALNRLLVGHTATPEALPAAVRAMDLAWASFEAAVLPLRYVPLGRFGTHITQLQAEMAAAWYYARSLGTVADHLEGHLEGPGLPGLREAADVIHRSNAVLAARLESGASDGTYLRATPLIANTIRELPHGRDPATERLSHALDDLMLLDAALARVAHRLDIRVADHDVGTVREVDVPTMTTDNR